MIDMAELADLLHGEKLYYLSDVKFVQFTEEDCEDLARKILELEDR